MSSNDIVLIKILEIASKLFVLMSITIQGIVCNVIGRERSCAKRKNISSYDSTIKIYDVKFLENILTLYLQKVFQNDNK